MGGLILSPRVTCTVNASTCVNNCLLSWFCAYIPANVVHYYKAIPTINARVIFLQ
jgi:hypothetical protein